jgi:hypothetical protein
MQQKIDMYECMNRKSDEFWEFGRKNHRKWSFGSEDMGSRSFQGLNDLLGGSGGNSGILGVFG